MLRPAAYPKCSVMTDRSITGSSTIPLRDCYELRRAFLHRGMGMCHYCISIQKDVELNKVIDDSIKEVEEFV